ncbi:MAG: hydrogenase maturation nickel metallochaperone HypA [Limnoraphis sp.]
MHELGITQNIVAIVSEHARGAPVKRVTLEIGKLSAIMPDAIQFCFDVCTQGTALEEATLEIIEVAGLGKCRQCGTEVPLDQPFGVCHTCNSLELDIIQGEELKIKEMEVEQLCV